MIQAGVSDSINPCLLGIAGMIILYLHTYQKPLKYALRKVWVFLLGYWCFLYLLNIGFYQETLYQPWFQIFGRLFFCVVGVVYLVAGVKYVSNWRSLYKKDAPLPCFQNVSADLESPDKPVISGLLGGIVAMVVAAVAAAVSSIWPPHYYVSVLGNMIFLPGKLQEVLLAYAVYQLFLFWGVWTAVFLYNKCHRYVSMEAETVFLRPTFLSMLAAAMYFGIGVSLNIIFIKDLFLVID